MRSWMPFLILLATLIFSGCTPSIPLTASPTSAPAETRTLTPIPPTPTATRLPTETPTATVTPTPVWVFQSGNITCPILLYHRIEDPPQPNSIAAQYYTSPADFQWQMQALKDWGYTTIPISLLVKAIMTGAQLPPRPVVITFDDGYETVYQNAYPIMQADGFVGVMYIVGTYIGANGYMDTPQLQEMTTNGWEIGSHSMTHPHLPAVGDQIGYEVGHSKNFLASKIGVNVETFAYPFGEIDSNGYIPGKVAEYGYFAAVGLGTQYVHSLNNTYSTLYYLSRIEVKHGTDLAAFSALLPWSGKP
jgi:peptidoglycan/xylan/chitin deacetylase (PgdA/CDA1 family)